MDAIAPVFLILAVVGFGLIVRLLAGGADNSRIEDYIRSRGGRLISCNWAPFGKGWFGEKNDRIYSVRYQDVDGHMHEASCKTSLFSGVYFTEDRIVSRAASHTPAPPSKAISRLEMLEEENRRLRKELSRRKNS
jgi:hypothetical protein